MIHGVPWFIRRRYRQLAPELEERRVENILRPRSGQVAVQPLDEFLPPVYPPDPEDSPEVQRAQAFLWSLHLIDDAFRGGR